MLRALVGWLVAVVLLPLRALRRATVLRKPAFVRLALEGSVDELPASRRAWRLLPRTSPPPRVALERLRALCDAVAVDPNAQGLVVSMRPMALGAASATSVREALARVRAAGKPLVVELPLGAGTREYLIASAATRLVAGPETSVAALGYAVESRYLRRLLDRAGVVPEVLARGEFKTAGESLARDAMSPEQRAQLGAVLDELDRELVGAVASGRGVPPERARAFIDGGPYLAPDAVAEGMLDATAYEDALARQADPGASGKVRTVDAGALLAARAPLVPAWRPRRIAVVRVRGAIVSKAPFALGRLAVDDAIIGALRVARESDRVAAVVLLVDSPGGSALASGRIHHEVERLAEKKPVVACFENVAASGGYYVAAGAHRIVAQPTTITGSIGVVSARLVVAPLLDRLGVVVERVARGERAGLGSMARALAPGERAALEREIDGYYRAFVGVVARGRKRAYDEVEPLARGRVWSGRAAHDAGLVDRLGGFDAALAEARALAGAGAERAEPFELHPPRRVPRPPELPEPYVEWLRSAAGEHAIDAVALAVAAPRERVLAWSGESVP